MGAADDRQAERSLLLRLDRLPGRAAGAWSRGLVLLALHASELLGVSQDQIHVLFLCQPRNCQ